MTSIADPTGQAGAADAPRPTALQLIDRWIYVFMAALFLATALAGFIPDSMVQIAMIKAGQRPPFPIVLHVHATLMGTWLLLLLAQTGLVATGRPAWHRQLGLISMVLAPAIVVTGFILVPTTFGTVWQAAQTAPAAVRAQLEQLVAILSNIALLQIHSGTMFAILIFWAIRVRQGDPGLHKRLMILATAMPLPAAIDRITWLPSTMPANPLSSELASLVWVSPMFAWDLFRLRRVHPAYLIALGAYLPIVAVEQSLWNTPGWLAFVPHLMGVAP